MRMPSRPVRKASNLTIDSALMAEANALAINVSRAAEAGIAEAVAQERARLWKRENQAAIDSWNAWTDANGIPLAGHRGF